MRIDNIHFAALRGQKWFIGFRNCEEYFYCRLMLSQISAIVDSLLVEGFYTEIFLSL